MNLFFFNVFLSPEINWAFSVISNTLNAQMRALNLMRALI